MIFVYKFLTLFLYPLFIFIIYVRKIFGKEDSIRFKEKIFLSSIQVSRVKSKKLIWFHAASIGEIQSIKNLIEYYHKNGYEILITTVTKTAAQLVKDKILKNDLIHHRYFPIDVTFLIRKFLNTWSPNLIIFVDSEIWPNLMTEIKKKNIRSLIVNARITKKTYDKWILFSSFSKKIFSIFDLCLTANNETLTFLKNLQAKNVKHFGNLKLSNSSPGSLQKGVNKDILTKKKFWCAVSTHKGEDSFFVKTHLKLKEKIKNIITIIIPRHINRSYQIKNEIQKLNLKVQVVNRDDKIDENKEILIINSFGNLNGYLNNAKSIFMGKSLLKRFRNTGGQNPIEAAKLGCKIYHGPYVYNFTDIYKKLGQLNISKEILNESDLATNIIEDFNTPKIRDLKSIEVIDKVGRDILQKTIREINKLL